MASNSQQAYESISKAISHTDLRPPRKLHATQGSQGFQATTVSFAPILTHRTPSIIAIAPAPLHRFNAGIDPKRHRNGLTDPAHGIFALILKLKFLRELPMNVDYYGFTHMHDFALHSKRAPQGFVYCIQW